MKNIEKAVLSKRILKTSKLIGSIKRWEGNPMIINSFEKDSFNDITISVDLEFNAFVILNTNKFKFFIIIKNIHNHLRHKATDLDQWLKTVSFLLDTII